MLAGFRQGSTKSDANSPYIEYPVGAEIRHDESAGGPRASPKLVVAGAPPRRWIKSTGDEVEYRGAQDIRQLPGRKA